jgi:hypothetical protein
MHDLKYALRSLAKSPGFAAAVILITAVGIGAVATMFSVLRGVVLQPLPFPQPDRLVALDAITDTGAVNSLSALDYFDYRAQCPAFESLAARSVWQSGRTVLGRGEAERVTTSKVSGNYFRTLGVQLAAGRSFTPAEEIAGGRKVVVVSHHFWQAKFGADPAAVGRSPSTARSTKSSASPRPTSTIRPALICGCRCNAAATTKADAATTTSWPSAGSRPAPISRRPKARSPWSRRGSRRPIRRKSAAGPPL